MIKLRFFLRDNFNLWQKCVILLKWLLPTMILTTWVWIFPKEMPKIILVFKNSRNDRSLFPFHWIKLVHKIKCLSKTFYTFFILCFYTNPLKLLFISNFFQCHQINLMNEFLSRAIESLRKKDIFWPLHLENLRLLMGSNIKIWSNFGHNIEMQNCLDYTDQRCKKHFSFCHPGIIVQYFLLLSRNFEWGLC